MRSRGVMPLRPSKNNRSLWGLLASIVVSFLLVLILPISFFLMMEEAPWFPKTAFHYDFLVMDSLQMAPTIEPRDLVIVAKWDRQPEVNDIVAYETEGSTSLKLSRIMGKSDGGFYVKTDEIGSEEGKTLLAERVRGVVKTRIPFIGYVVSLLRQPIYFFSVLFLVALGMAIRGVLRRA